MAEVELAEQRLAMARRAASKAFREAGKDTDGMFAESTFVLRTSAEAWVDKARQEKAKAEAPAPPLSPEDKATFSANLRAAFGGARLKGTPFAKLQALPKDAKPVVTWGDRDSAFVDVTDGLRNAIQDLVGTV